MADLNSQKCQRCRAYDSFVTDFKSGEVVCNKCGLVIEERLIDDTIEERNFGSENSGNKGESRVGGPLKATDRNNLGTNIVVNDKNGIMKKLKGVNNTYNQSSADRGFEEINKLLEQKGIARSIIEDTKEIFDQVTKVKKMKGRNIKCMILAMYYCASKNEGVSLSFKEIANRFNFEEKKIKKAFNYIKSAIVYNLSPDKLNQSILSLIQNFLETKNETFEYKDLADKIALKINESCLLEGRNPNTIAALSLLTASQIIKPNGINRSIICQNFCSENTLDNAFDKIKDSLDKIIPENFYSENKNLSIK